MASVHLLWCTGGRLERDVQTGDGYLHDTVSTWTQHIGASERLNIPSGPYPRYSSCTKFCNLCTLAYRIPPPPPANSRSLTHHGPTHLPASAARAATPASVARRANPRRAPNMSPSLGSSCFASHTTCRLSSVLPSTHVR